MPKEIVFAAKGISKSFGDFKVLNNVSIELRDSEIFGLLGPNGAGKSTLTKIAIGQLCPDKGSLSFYGQPVTDFNKLNRYFGVVPQEVSCFYDFTLKQNMHFFGSLYGLPKDLIQKRIDGLLKWLGLTKFEHKRVAHLSGGYKRLTNIALALVHDPDIIFMDEPTVGLDPNKRQQFWDRILELRELGKTICLTTHYMDEAEHLCNHIAMIDQGKKLVEGSPRNLIKDHGGVRILVLKLNNPFTPELTKQLSSNFPKENIQSVGQHLIVAFQRERSLQKISRLTTWVAAQGFEVISSNIKEPELEDVFVNLTGRKVSEEIEPAGNR